MSSGPYSTIIGDASSLSDISPDAPTVHTTLSRIPLPPWTYARATSSAGPVRSTYSNVAGFETRGLFIGVGCVKIKLPTVARMDTKPTTRKTAELCHGACVAKFGAAECRPYDQFCGLRNNATGEHAGTEQYVQCIHDALGSGGASAGDAFKAAALQCSRGR